MHRRDSSENRSVTSATSLSQLIAAGMPAHAAHLSEKAPSVKGATVPVPQQTNIDVFKVPGSNRISYVAGVTRLNAPVKPRQKSINAWKSSLRDDSAGNDIGALTAHNIQMRDRNRRSRSSGVRSSHHRRSAGGISSDPVSISDHNGDDSPRSALSDTSEQRRARSRTRTRARSPKLATSRRLGRRENLDAVARSGHLPPPPPPPHGNDGGDFSSSLRRSPSGGSGGKSARGAKAKTPVSLSSLKEEARGAQNRKAALEKDYQQRLEFFETLVKSKDAIIGKMRRKLEDIVRAGVGPADSNGADSNGNQGKDASASSPKQQSAGAGGELSPATSQDFEDLKKRLTVSDQQREDLQRQMRKLQEQYSASMLALQADQLQREREMRRTIRQLERKLSESRLSSAADEDDPDHPHHANDAPPAPPSNHEDSDEDYKRADVPLGPDDEKEPAAQLRPRLSPSRPQLYQEEVASLSSQPQQQPQQQQQQSQYARPLVSSGSSGNLNSGAGNGSGAVVGAGGSYARSASDYEAAEERDRRHSRRERDQRGSSGYSQQSRQQARSAHHHRGSSEYRRRSGSVPDQDVSSASSQSSASEPRYNPRASAPTEQDRQRFGYSGSGSNQGPPSRPQSSSSSAAFRARSVSPSPAGASGGRAGYSFGVPVYPSSVANPLLERTDSRRIMEEKRRLREERIQERQRNLPHMVSK